MAAAGRPAVPPQCSGNPKWLGGDRLQEAYLDNSATTVVCPEAAEKALMMMTRCYGNPSSLHSKGIEAERELMAAREAVAAQLRVQPREVVFTSGGTEANNLALFGAAEAQKRRGRRIVTTQMEHSSVLAAAHALERQGFEVVYLQPGADGRITEEQLMEAVNAETILVSVMAVNNEVGAVQPLTAARRAIRRRQAPALLHTDAVQAFGKLALYPEKLGVDLLSLSGHKIHAPKGVGALYIAPGARILPRQFGGEQERGLRPGTEAAPLIAALGEAVRALPPVEEEAAHMQALAAYCKERLCAIPGVFLNSPADAAPYILNFSLGRVRSETMLHFLAARGVFVSGGSACARGKLSHVLESMGLPRERIVSAVRVSFSRYNTKEDVDQLAEGVRAGLRDLVQSGRA
jgi:cysteine desulfurase